MSFKASACSSWYLFPAVWCNQFGAIRIALKFYMRLGRLEGISWDSSIKIMKPQISFSLWKMAQPLAWRIGHPNFTACIGESSRWNSVWFWSLQSQKSGRACWIVITDLYNTHFLLWNCWPKGLIVSFPSCLLLKLLLLFCLRSWQLLFIWERISSRFQNVYIAYLYKLIWGRSMSCWC